MKPWKTISRETVLEMGSFLRVEKHVVELPDQRIIDDWSWVVVPDYVNVVALTPENEFICFKQVKYAVDGVTLAIVGGMIDSGETPLDTARRELLEETGYESPDWISLGQFRVDANRGVAMASLFLARNCVRTSDPQPDDLEEQEIIFLSKEEILSSVKRGEFRVVSWTTALLLAFLNCE